MRQIEKPVRPPPHHLATVGEASTALDLLITTARLVVFRSDKLDAGALADYVAEWFEGW